MRYATNTASARSHAVYGPVLRALCGLAVDDVDDFTVTVERPINAAMCGTCLHKMRMVASGHEIAIRLENGATLKEVSYDMGMYIDAVANRYRLAMEVAGEVVR